MQTTLEQNIERLNEETYLASLEKNIRLACEEAHKIGGHAGVNAAQWFEQDAWGGRVTRGEKEAAESFLMAYEDGGELPEPPNLSGEWADSETPASLMSRLFGEDWENVPQYVDAQDEICQSWEYSASEEFLAYLVESANSIIS